MQEAINFLLFFLGMIMLFHMKKWLYYLLFKIDIFFEKRIELNLGYKLLNTLGLVSSMLLFIILLFSSMFISLYFVEKAGFSDIKNINFLTTLLDFLSTNFATKIAKKKAKMNEYDF